MVTTKKPENIVLGCGVFKVDGVTIGLTRDGGKFSVERDYRKINADGDRGTVKGRVLLKGGIPKLSINHLEILSAFDKLHPAIKLDTESVPGTTKIKGTGKILESDYHEVEFDGETKDGKDVVIKVYNAINLENIDWEMKDKDEIIDKVSYEGCYEENAVDPFEEPWDISYVTGV